MPSAESQAAVAAAHAGEKEDNSIPPPLTPEEKLLARRLSMMKFRGEADLLARLPLEFAQDPTFHEVTDPKTGEGQGFYSYRGKVIVSQDLVDDVLASEWRAIGVAAMGRIRFKSIIDQHYWCVSGPAITAFLNGDPDHQMYRQRRRSQMTRAYVANAPGETVGVDLTYYPLLGQKGLITCVDFFSKKVACRTFNSKRADLVWDKVREMLEKDLVGARRLRTDRGKEFEGAFAEGARAMGIKVVYSQPHNPTSNGLVEHTHGVVKQYFSSAVPDKAREIQSGLRRVLAQYNRSVNPRTGFTPDQLNATDLPPWVIMQVRARLRELAAKTESNLRFQKPLQSGDKVRLDVKEFEAIYHKGKEQPIKALMKAGQYKSSHYNAFSEQIFTVKHVYPSTNSASLVEDVPGQPVNRRYPRGSLLLIPPDTRARTGAKPGQGAWTADADGDAAAAEAEAEAVATTVAAPVASRTRAARAAQK